ncbi:hypothetical protein ACFFLS_09940 [Flavobacterium procerum]|uniref:SH3 domain-containing protein n=1 Tax=Flavobacterium procerum TaxID=1455569 RepID=A0ABV6BPH7_9FLAO
MVNLVLISCLFISCKENNSSSSTKTAKVSEFGNTGIVSAISGTIIYSENSVESEKIGKLNYAEKVTIVNLNNDKKLLGINLNGKYGYVEKAAIEIISPEVNKKSYFTKDCYCLLKSNKIKTINFPTKFDTIHFLFNDDKINMVQQILYYRKGSDEKITPIDTTNLGYSTVYRYIDKNNNFTCQVIDPDKNERFLDCYNTRTNYKIRENKTTFTNSYDDVIFELYFAKNLFNLDVCYAKIDYPEFIDPLQSFDFKNQNLIIEQEISQINKNIPVRLYDINTSEPVAYNQCFLFFNYLRDIKIIEKNGKKRYFAKINIPENEDSALKGEFYIDLKEVAMFASITY